MRYSQAVPSMLNSPALVGRHVPLITSEFQLMFLLLFVPTCAKLPAAHAPSFNPSSLCESFAVRFWPRNVDISAHPALVFLSFSQYQAM
jgi:hypothetical protein